MNDRVARDTDIRMSETPGGDDADPAGRAPITVTPLRSNGQVSDRAGLSVETANTHQRHRMKNTPV